MEEDEVIPSLDDLLDALDREEEDGEGGGSDVAEAAEERSAGWSGSALIGRADRGPNTSEERAQSRREEAKRIAEAEHRAFAARLRREESRAERDRQRRAEEAALEARERACMAAEEAPERERRASLAASRREEETRRQLEKQRAKRQLQRSQEAEAARRLREQGRQRRREERRRREAERQERELRRLRAKMERLASQGYVFGPEGWVRGDSSGEQKDLALEPSITPSEENDAEEEEEEEEEEDAEEGEDGLLQVTHSEAQGQDSGADSLEVVDQRPQRRQEEAEVRPLEELLAELDRSERQCWASGERVPALEEVLAVVGNDERREEEEREAVAVKQDFASLGRIEVDEDEASRSSAMHLAKQMRPDFDWSAAAKAEETLKHYNYDFEESKQEGTNSLEERRARSAAISAKLEKARNRMSMVRWKAAEAAEASRSASSRGGPRPQELRAAALPCEHLQEPAEDGGELRIAGWPWAPREAEPSSAELQPGGIERGYQGRSSAWRSHSYEPQEVD